MEDETSRVARRERRESDLHRGRSVLDLSPARRRRLHFIHSGSAVEPPSQGAYRRASRIRSDISPIKDIHGLAITVAAAMPRGRGARYLPTLPVAFRSSRTTDKATPVSPREPRQPRRWRTEGHPWVPRRVGVRCPRSGRGPIWLRPLFHHPVARSLADSSLASPSPRVTKRGREGGRERAKRRADDDDDDDDGEVLSRGGCDHVATLRGGGIVPLSDAAPRQQIHARHRAPVSGEGGREITL